MKEHPIIFSGQMVRAILDGRKTQTRRVVKPQPEPASCHPKCEPRVSYLGGGDWSINWATPKPDGEGHPNRFRHPFDGDWRDRDANSPFRCPYGATGDRLWVRETHAMIWPDECEPEDIRDCNIEYRADGDPMRLAGEWPSEFRGDPDVPRWRPSIHMPRWASRITLEVVDVRVERLQEITEADAVAEGVYGELGPLDITARPLFGSLWNNINAKRGYSWESNPWVWCVEFKTVGGDS